MMVTNWKRDAAAEGGVREKARAAARAALLFLLAVLVLPSPAQAQERADLGALYRQARTEAIGRRLALRPVEPVLLPMPPATPYLDSLRARRSPSEKGEATEPALAPLPPIRSRHVVRRLGRPVFEQRFPDVRWAYLGANGPGALDTMRTREVRARLQAHYGAPTRTVVDADSLSGLPHAEYIQFEYWFVINGAFPVKVMDTGGPFDRGVIFAAPAHLRERLTELRAAVLAPLLQTRLRGSYVDYFFDADAGDWYRAGFDGRRFFVEPVRAGRVMPGRRPVIDAPETER